MWVYEDAKFFLEWKQEPAGQNPTKLDETLPKWAKPYQAGQNPTKLGQRTILVQTATEPKKLTNNFLFYQLNQNKQTSRALKSINATSSMTHVWAESFAEHPL